MNFDVIHSVEEVNGRRKFSIKGISKDTNRTYGKLYFNRKHGKNIAITGDGRTEQKLNLDEPHHSTAFTHRPLRNDEVFQVRLDKKNTKYSYSLGIGILLKSPDDIDLPPQFWKTSLAWIMHNDKIYQNSTAVNQNYGKNLNELQVGDRVGVMRSRFGALHFFVNGVDQGPALAHIPETVYGLLELWYNAAKATIVDRESSLR
ncbi:hypothetical protein J437_LFUL019452 [Ladona fulva]|uniref:NHR domain-containing protein n=1 Tax=Ladona fulva TaxID=123851 RepID=A0A8K0KU49_LADFU|nr:hypothetical protein J437_LFUL019452 [Ladona fulva]